MRETARGTPGGSEKGVRSPWPSSPCCSVEVGQDEQEAGSLESSIDKRKKMIWHNTKKKEHRQTLLIRQFCQLMEAIRMRRTGISVPRSGR